MIHFYLSSYPESTGAHYSVGISPPFDYTKNCPVVEKYGKRKARCRLTPREARDMANELRRFADEVDVKRGKLAMHEGQRNQRRR